MVTIIFCDLHSTHGGDVKTEQATAHNGDGRDNVDVHYLIHLVFLAVFTSK